MKQMNVKRVFSLLLCLMMAVSALLPMNTHAFAESTSSAALDARESVVRVVTILVNEDESIQYLFGHGSGFFVGQTGKPVDTIVTNKHVVEDYYAAYQLGNLYFTELPVGGQTVRFTHPVTGQPLPLRFKLIVQIDGEEYNVKKVIPSVIEGADVAIVMLDQTTTKRKAIVLGNTDADVNVTDTAYVLGYPGYSDTPTFDNTVDVGITVGDTIFNDTTLPSRVRDQTVTKGTVTRLNVVSQGVDNIQIDAAASHGNSGGPIINEKGYVLGILTSGDEGVGIWGIDVKYIKDFLKQNDVAFVSSTDAAPSTPTEKPTASPTPTLKPSPEPTPEPSPTPAPDPGLPVWLIIVIAAAAVVVIAAVAALLVSNSKKKKAAAAKAAELERQRKAEEERRRIEEMYRQPEIGATAALDTVPTGGKIRITAGTMKGAVVPAADGETIWVGKDAKSCSIVFDPNKFGHVSRMHCAITYSASDKKYYVTDNSSNGTLYRDSKKKLPRGVRVAVNPGTELLLARDDAAILLE